MQQNKETTAEKEKEIGVLNRGQANLDGSGTRKCKP